MPLIPSFTGSSNNTSSNQLGSSNTGNSYTGNDYPDDIFTGSSNNTSSNNTSSNQLGNSYTGNDYPDDIFTGSSSNTSSNQLGDSYTGNDYPDDIFTGSSSNTVSSSNNSKSHIASSNSSNGSKMSNTRSSQSQSSDPERRGRSGYGDSVGGHGCKGSSGSGGRGGAFGIDEVNLALAAEGAKEAFGAAAKSLFGFAAFAAKKVEETVTRATLQTEYQCGRTSVRAVRVLAEGGFGTVHLVESSSNPHKKFALKILICQSREQIDDAHAELDALQRVANDHVIRLVDHSSTMSKQHGASARQVLMLFPLYQQTCWDRIEAKAANEDDPWCFSERQARKACLGVARALEAMHRLGLAHNDVKPHNVLLTEAHEAVLMDLGSVGPVCREVTTRSQALQVEELASSKTSAAYRAPELTSTPYPSSIDGRSDVFSLGCTMYCLAFGRSPFETSREGVSRLAILNGRYTFPEGFCNRDCFFSDRYIDTLVQCLQVSIEARPSAADLVEFLS